jgi:hypothetical protein
MTLHSLFTFDQLPTTSAAAIREFNDRYLAAIAVSRPTGWADTLGDLIPTDRPMVTFPVSQLRTLYRKTEGESRFKKLGEKSFDVKAEEFDDGYEARLLDLFLKVFAYRNWQQAPQRLVLAEEQFRHASIAAQLNSGASTVCVDGTNFFSTSHPANLTDATVKSPITGLTTWSNYQASAKNILGSTAVGTTGPFSTDLLQKEVTSMQSGVLDENGNLMMATPDTILVPMDYLEPTINMLANNMLYTLAYANSNNEIAAAAVDNVYKGRFNVVGVKEFALTSGSTADWYLVDSKMVRQGIAPWLSMRMTVPQTLALRIFDEATDYFKNTGNIKISSHIWYGFSLALPHAIRKVVGPTR